MSFILRLTDERAEALRARAAKEGRSVEEVFDSALEEYLLRADEAERSGKHDALIERLKARHERERELYDRLAK